MVNSISRVAVLLSVLQAVLAGGRLHKTKLPSTGEDWIDMPEGASFQPATTLDQEKAVTLRSAQRRFLGYDQQFVDGTETYYDDYAQAWRLIGFYIDCNAEEYEQEADDRRKLEGEGGDNEACARYLLWAAYIDMDYSGGGIAEYQFYNRKKDSWRNNTCSADNERCVKMDCHLPDTHFQLLGYFKEPNWAQWMEQLFKHEGVCIWTSSEYTFMQNYREVWPEGCTATEIKVDGNYLYYDMKPQHYAGMGIGLYTDSRCSVDYTGDLYTPENILYNEDVYGLIKYNDDWNSAFDIYKTCQPCKAYSLASSSYTCSDDAGYTNVNQCMKFATHTYMWTASFMDIILASEQGTITQVTIGEKVYGSDYFGNSKSITIQDIQDPGWIISGASALVFIIGGIMLFRSWRKSRMSPAMREPLVASRGVSA